jgi:iron complex transport system substrate-binding protein
MKEEFVRAAAEQGPSSSVQEDVLFKNRIGLLSLILVVVACNGGATTPTEGTSTTTAVIATTTTSPPTEQSFPADVTAANGEVVIPERPEAIVSLSATATEMLFAIGAGDQVVAVDSLSNYPEEAPVTDLAAFTPSAEAVASYSPDLVVIAFDTNDLLAGLAELEIPTLLMPAAATLEEVWAQLAALGTATGNSDQTGEVVAALQSDLNEVVQGTDLGGEALSYYYELDPSYFSATSATFIGSLIGQLGLQNIADPADADGAAFGFPQLTAEAIIAADPDLILLADTLCCGQNAATVAARPGWESMKAVVGNGVVELNDDVASRWGPRIVDLLSQIAEAAADVAASS